MGLLLRDGMLVQFTEEDEHSDETPGYIVQSPWSSGEMDAFDAYIKVFWNDVKLARAR